MTIQEIYELAIKMGTAADPRGRTGVKKALTRVKKEYEEMPKKKQEDFDLESLQNPYSDTRILFGDGSTVVDKVLVGIDIGVGEVVLTDRLNEKGEGPASSSQGGPASSSQGGIDLIIGHHPHGRALAALDEVMELQIEMLATYGLPINVAESLMRERIQEVYRTFAPRNHFQSVDAARLLNLPFMCVHTPTDNLGWKYLSERLEKKNFETLADVLEELDDVSEFKIGKKQKAGPVIFVGQEKSRAGKVRVVEFTGGTESAKEIYERLSHAGVGTVIGMHVSEEHRKEAKKHHMNLIVTGHMVSDSLGINLFLDELNKKGVGVLPCSGLIRVSRNKQQKL